MAEDAYTLGAAGVGAGGGAYRMHAPNYHMYVPSTVEQQYAGAMATKLEPNYLLGFMLGAEGDRRASTRQYGEQLDAANVAQQRAAALHSATEHQKATYSLLGKALEHPDQAYAFTGTRELFAPDALQHGARLAEAGVGLTEGRAVESAGKGAQAFVEAGVAPPQGSTYTRLGLPNAPRVQGTPLDLQVAGVNAAARVASARSGGESGTGAYKLPHLTGVANAVDDIGQHRQAAINSEVRAAFQQAGATYAADGTMLTPPKLTAEQQAGIVSGATQRADAIARQRYDTMQGIYTRGGHGGIVPPNSYALSPAAPPTQTDPGGSGTPTVAPGPPAMATGGATGNTRASTAPQNRPPATQPQASVSPRLTSQLAQLGVPNAGGRAAEVQRAMQQHGSRNYDIVTAQGGKPVLRIGSADGTRVVQEIPLR